LILFGFGCSCITVHEIVYFSIWLQALHHLKKTMQMVDMAVTMEVIGFCDVTPCGLKMPFHLHLLARRELAPPGGSVQPVRFKT
jgi:hypothetical protein